MKTFNPGKHATQNYELQPVLLFFFFSFCIFFYYFILLQVKHTQKKKEKLNRINKEIKRKKTTTKKKQTNSEFTHLHPPSYMAIYLQTLKYVTAVLIPYITVLSMIYN